MNDSLRDPSWDRRQWLQWTALIPGAAVLSGCAEHSPISSTPTPAPASTTPVVYDHLMKFRGKVPLRAVNDRPPCLETPWEYFKTDLTPNDAFYVRWHLQTLPQVDMKTWKLRLGGHVDKPLEFNLDELKKMEPVSVVAVNQCSGNSRALFSPKIPGAQWNNGAMGNAKWTGVRLRDLLQKTGIKAGAVDVTFKGLDEAKSSTIQDYTKALPLDQAQRDEVLVAYAMNDADLPALNGFPVRLVVPGWFATYWVKALSDIQVLNKTFDGYWVKTAYRVPKPGQTDKPGDLAKETVPINRLMVRSFFVTPIDNSSVSVGKVTALDGIAFDGGSGIKQVQVSADGGKTWETAQLGTDHGPYSFRRWRLEWTPKTGGDYRLLVKATNNAGETQGLEPTWSRSGYLRNVVEAWNLKAS
jgi:sulfite dehydrogenase